MESEPLTEPALVASESHRQRATASWVHSRSAVVGLSEWARGRDVRNVEESESGVWESHRLSFAGGENYLSRKNESSRRQVVSRQFRSPPFQRPSRDARCEAGRA